MNGFAMLAESYRDAGEQGKIPADLVEKEVKVLDFLSTCTLEDIYRLVDTSAFNDIIVAYTKMAMKNAGVEEEKMENALVELKCLFDTKSASDVCSGD